MSELEAFLLNDRIRNEWITTDKFRVYLRKAWRVLGEERAQTLDIGTINIINLEERGQGHFKTLLAEIIEKCPFCFIYIENVQEEQFAQYFEKNGWTRDARYESDFCYYLRVKPDPDKKKH